MDHVDITLLSPSAHLRYSGMVPGWISDEYDEAVGLVDLARLAHRANADCVLDSCVAIDPEQRLIRTAKGQTIPFDLCSINTGGVGRARAILGDDRRILDVRPIGDFDTLSAELASDAFDPRHFAVLGGGAGGVELAFGLRNARGRKTQRVTLVTGKDGLLPGFGWLARQLTARALARQEIALIEAEARIEAGSLIAGAGAIDQPDHIIAALGSAAPEWPAESGLAVDNQGFIEVDRFQRSTSHPHIFASGDVASRQDETVPHSGVHAVHTGPILSQNLREVACGQPPVQTYRPNPASLYLLSTGDGSAILAYGPIAAQGRWVRNLKDRIDKRWLATYSDDAPLM